MSEVVVVGSLNMDLVVRTERLPEAGETISGQSFRTIPGGKGANQAVAIARLGGTVSLVGRVGADVFGHQLVEGLAAQGINTKHVRVDAEAPTGTATIIVDASGENRIIVVAGANGRVSEADVDSAQAAIRGAKMLVLQFEVPLATIEHAIDLAVHYRVPVILNPAPAPVVSPGFLNKANYLILNETEAHRLCGIEVVDLSSARQAAERLRAGGIDVVILTLGEKGAFVATREESFLRPTRAVPVVDTTAAGDAFVGGIAVSLVRGLSISDAVRFANAAGTLAVSKFGAQTSLPTADQVNTFLSS